MKKPFLVTWIVLCILVTPLFVVMARADYKPLQPIPGFNQDEGLPGYLNSLVNVIIAIVGISAVIMIMYGGVKYMSIESWSGKGDAKKIITGAVLGLLLAFTSWIILFTIDEDLIKIDLELDILGVVGTNTNVAYLDFEDARDNLVADIAANTGRDPDDVAYTFNELDNVVYFPYLPVDEDGNVIGYQDLDGEMWRKLEELCKKHGFTTVEPGDVVDRREFNQRGLSLANWMTYWLGTDGGGTLLSTMACSRRPASEVFAEKNDNLETELDNITITGEEPIVIKEQQEKATYIFVDNVEDKDAVSGACRKAGFVHQEEISIVDSGYEDVAVLQNKRIVKCS